MKRLLAVLFCLLAISGNVLAQTQTMVIKKPPAPPKFFPRVLTVFSATSINNSGLMCGNLCRDNFRHAATLKGVKLTDLFRIIGGQGDSFANDINDNGNVVGTYHRVKGGPPVSSPFLVSGSRSTDLVGMTLANSLSNNDRVAGVGNFSGESHAAMWDNGSVIDLGVLPESTSSFANGINDNLQVVGASLVGSDNHAFYWSNGSIEDINPPSSRASEATDINQSGVICGWFTDFSDITHAITWEDYNVTELGDLGGNFSKANAINENGKVVGISKTSKGDLHAFFWENGKMYDLSALVPSVQGCFLEEAIAINNSDQIICLAVKPSKSENCETFFATVLLTRRQ